MREIRTSGSMSGDGKRSHGRTEAPPMSESWRQQLLPGPSTTAPILDSTQLFAASRDTLPAPGVLAPRFVDGLSVRLLARAFARRE